MPDVIVVAMREAVEARDLAKLREVLTANPDYLEHSSGGRWILEDAINAGDLEVIELLVDLGIDLTAPPKILNGWWPLERAASRGQDRVIRLLLKHGVPANREVDGKLTSGALLSAAIQGSLECVKLLVENGANVEYSASGVNALMHADYYGHTDVAEYLRSIGLRDLREITPPQYEAAHQELVRILAEHDGEPDGWMQRVSDSPPITIHHCPPKNKRAASQMLFTLGLSDRNLPRGNNPFFCLELRMRLSAKWKLNGKAQANDVWNWPLREMGELARKLSSCSTWPTKDFLFPYDHPPRPFHPKTGLCYWLLASPGHTYQMPDLRWISVFDMIPLYAEEAELVRTSGKDDLMRLFSKFKVPECITPDRKNVAL